MSGPAHLGRAVTVKATALERPASFVAIVQIEDMNGAGP